MMHYIAKEVKLEIDQSTELQFAGHYRYISMVVYVTISRSDEAQLPDSHRDSNNPNRKRTP
jgi:hypothetical protein